MNRMAWKLNSINTKNYNLHLNDGKTIDIWFEFGNNIDLIELFLEHHQ